MKNLIISVLALLASLPFEQTLIGSNSEIICNNFIIQLKTNIISFDYQEKIKTKLNNGFELQTNGDHKLKVIIINGNPTKANATINIVSPNCIEVIGPEFIEEGNIYEYYVPDTTWNIEVINISEDAEVNYSYE